MAVKRKKITIQDLQTKKDLGEKIVRVTCYDYPMALLADRAGVDSVLVGDSLGMVVLGVNIPLVFRFLKIVRDTSQKICYKKKHECFLSKITAIIHL